MVETADHEALSPGDAMRGPGPSRAPLARSRPATLRSVGLLAGLSLVGISFALSSGATAGNGFELPTELRAGIGALLGDSSAGTRASATDDATPPTANAPGPGSAQPIGETPATGQAPAVGAAALAAPTTPDISVVGVRRLDGGALKAVVRMERPADIDDATRTRLERRLGEDDWAADAWVEAGEQMLAVMRPGTSYRFRVRTIDAGGDETVSEAARVKLAVRGPRSDRLIRSGGWELRPGPSGGPRLVAAVPGAFVRTEFEGSDVAVVGRDDLVQDPVSVRIDGGPWDADPAAGDRLGRWVLFSEELEEGAHAVEVRAPANGLGVDAILILRSLQA
jgi:hypothetical protein